MENASLTEPFLKRRQDLVAREPRAAFLFPANWEVIRNRDVAYPFRQASDFYYLTGLEEPDAFLVLRPECPSQNTEATAAGSASVQVQSYLFVHERNPKRELWEGELYGPERAKTSFQVTEAYGLGQLNQKLPELLSGVEKVFYPWGMNEALDRQVFAALNELQRRQGRSGKGRLPLEDPLTLMGELRLKKSEPEIKKMKKAAEISAEAHCEAIRNVKPGMKEYEIQALVEYVFQKRGCSRPAYGSIVAGGANATCLHYTKVNGELNEGDLLLIDAGGEYEYYAADITRTFPVGRNFSREQAQIYDLVLQAQKEAIALVKPGVRMNELHERAVEVIVDGLLEIGLLQGGKKELIDSTGYKRFFPHKLGHWLGMDVHDVGCYTASDGQSRELQPGMSFTIEPGIYFQPNDENVPEKYRGMGIRIEDDILVRENGCEVLSEAVPKERDAIESMRG